MTCETIIADDITGAGDSGVHFALAGKRTALLLDRTALAPTLRAHEAVAVSSESRFLSPARAAAAVRDAAAECRRAGARVAFKKVDSTLRGNPGAETEAILEATGQDAALVCVAMPKTGRTCRDGVLLLHGTPIKDTEMGRDPFNPVLFSAISEILAQQTALPQSSLALEVVRRGREAMRAAVAAAVSAGARIIVADAATDADLASIGELLRGMPGLLPVGAGGLAEAFTGGAVPLTPAEPRGRMLAVVGSLTQVTAGQLRFAREYGDFHFLELDIGRAFSDPGAEISRLAAEAAAEPRRNLLLMNRVMPRSGGAGAIATEEGVRAAGIFGDTARAICEATDCALLYVTGGSTAVAVAASLGLSSVLLERECMPGVVLGSCSRPGAALRWFITKAGGFGAPDTIVRLADGALISTE